MFHSLRLCLTKFLKRLGALIIYFSNYKITLFSLIYIIFDFVYIKLLRNIKGGFSFCYIFLDAGLLLGVFLVRILLRNISARYPLKRFTKKACGISLFFFDMLICVLLSGTISYIRVKSAITQEQNISNESSSFTHISTTFNAIVVTETSQKHTYDNLEISLLSPLSFENKTLQKEGHRILVKVKKYQHLRVGDICMFRGTLELPQNFQEFNYQDYLINNDIYLLMEFPEITCNGKRGGFGLQNILIDFKENLNNTIAKNLKEPQSSLLMGIVFGQDRLFSEEFDTNIRIAGVSHIVAASGYNITILLIAGNTLFKRFPSKLRIPLLLVLIWCFCIFSGLSPSILRACIMTTIALIAQFFGRKNSVHISLSLASAVFVLIDPKIVFNIGFQLSVMATAGLIYIQPTLSHISELLFKKKISFLQETLFTTLSCTLITLPITIYTFKTLSIWSVLANCLILPVIEMTMFFGVGGIIFSKISFLISKIFFQITNIQLKYFELVVNMIGNINWGYWEFENIPNMIPIAIMILLTIMCIYFYPVGDETHNYYLKIFD